MIKVQGQTLNVLEKILFVRALTIGYNPESERDAALKSKISYVISFADEISIVSIESLPKEAQHLFSAFGWKYYVGECVGWDYRVGDCDGDETALYILKE